MESLKKLFFNESLRHWHFEVLVKECKLSRERVNYFLKILLKEKFILRVKLRAKMPYYVANRELAAFREQKRLWGLQELSRNGLFEYIRSLSGVTTAIIFGSFARGDWNKSSDVDIFIYGPVRDFDKKLFEKRLKRPLQLFLFDDSKTLKQELDPGILPNIVKGFNITGNLQPFTVSIDA
ncbi:MAG TPA: nucleotidyltransferase domain-containing protein [Candidatus Nanoarchaeia archaeon]|nr:nucleotidyltransferase domain-containing protein [Candidatus Nanoarchaeia archaeon]